MEGTILEAADVLGVSRRQAQLYAAQGRIQTTRVIGRSVLVDLSSVHALASARGRGRRWNAATSWAAIDLLTGVAQSQHPLTAATALGASQRSRLRHRLATMTATDLVYFTASRAIVTRYRQTRGRTGDLRARLLLTGTTALSDIRTAALFGLAAGQSEMTDGYCAIADADRIVASFGLVNDSDGQVLLRTTTRNAIAGAVTIALDLADRGSTRDRVAGKRYLQALLT